MVFALVECMGRRVYAGRIEQVVVAGAPMLRVLVPEVERELSQKDYGDWGTTATKVRTVRERYPAFKVDLGGGALFAVTECSEEVARAHVPSCYRPEGFGHTSEYGPWELAAAALPGPVEDAEIVLDEDDPLTFNVEGEE